MNSCDWPIFPTKILGLHDAKPTVQSQETAFSSPDNRDKMATLETITLNLQVVTAGALR
jgi:hypothetical protein